MKTGTTEWYRMMSRKIDKTLFEARVIRALSVGHVQGNFNYLVTAYYRFYSPELSLTINRTYDLVIDQINRELSNKKKWYQFWK